MSEAGVRATGAGVTVAYAILIGWLAVSQPQSLADVAGGLAATVGAYEVDAVDFEDGLRLFRQDQFEAARAAWARADPASRDARTQFYVAYSYYRQGWGRVYDDDVLFGRGLEALGRAENVSPSGRVVVDDPTLGLRTSAARLPEVARIRALPTTLPVRTALGCPPTARGRPRRRRQ